MKVNEVYVTAQGNKHRRIIAVMDGRVIYSIGGNSNRHCLVTTFKKWIRSAHATVFSQ